ncbi:hypothetical protein FIV42_20775 [Persicimonas caeni]|uniref:Uncharacterized protein n=1 Tax=Persicimonas caeni TaxID=2292766 RepID=A0A4Y6PXX0_PERCE|nr:hypothetical protein [Persicimonas caeni]QDG53090.1 hypothetical protein FIV42_20775 [Persicimonas caeni]QED34312.1 hypothetical protein FRD00_20770 [Persicimonas caeni]
MSSRVPGTSKREPRGRGWQFFLIVALALLGGTVGLKTVCEMYLEEFTHSRPRPIYSAATQTQSYYEKHCRFPPSLPPTARLSSCVEGAICMPDEVAFDLWEAEGFELPREQRMSISGVRVGSEAYKLIERADFSPGGSMHTTTVTVRGSRDDGRCVAKVGPMSVINEFQ